MIEANLELVHVIASEFRGSVVPEADIVQEGAIGLITALDRFDHRRGIRFATYAGWWIRGSMLRALSEARPIRLPARVANQVAAIRLAEAAIETSGASRASDASIAHITGLSTSTVRNLRGAPYVAKSLDVLAAETTVSGDALIDGRISDVTREVVLADERHRLSVILRLLPQRHREVILRRYGIDGRHPQTHREIAGYLGISQQRSRQLEREALRRIREVAEPQLGTEPRSRP